MRRIFFSLLVLGMSTGALAQAGFQASFSYVGNTISFKIRPTADITANFSVIEFFVREPVGEPSFTWGPILENATNFPGIGTNATVGGGFDSAVSTAGGYVTTHFFYTAPNPPTTPRLYSSGQEYEVFSVTVNADPATLNLQLVQSPDDDPYYVNLTDGTGNLIRVSDLTTIFYPTTNTSGDPYFLALALQAPAPAFFREFNVAKRGNSDASLMWITSSEQNVSHFILERSNLESSGWTAFSEVRAKGNSVGPTHYSFEDLGVYDGRKASILVYYRIRAIDFDGQAKIFPIRSLRFTATGSKKIEVYPNPAKRGFYVTIPLFNPISSTVRLNLVNRQGQVVHAREINSNLANNYYYNIETPGVINGEYMLQIVYNGDILETKKIVVTR